MISPTLKETLKQTTSRCPTCQAAVPAEVWKTTGTPAKVYLTRTCAEHGEATACITSDARFYWLAKGDPSNACGAGCACAADSNGITGTLGRNAGAMVPEVEVLSTCLSLIEIVDSCNLACENTELGDILHRFEMMEKDAFRLFIKPFMDAWTWDQDRIDRCCTHVIRPDGMLDSFCRYYATGGGK